MVNGPFDDLRSTTSVRCAIGVAWLLLLAATPAQTDAQAHWAYRPVGNVAPPRVDDASVLHPIDRFVRARLAARGLAPEREASRSILIRRVALDLTGLPPTSEEVDAFVGDARPGAYERMVDRYLVSERFGEQWARMWLDLARYADTKGYEQDGNRTIWPWRDWVIDAFNRDLPFDQFTVEQIAGDLLPAPTREQLLATGFHRNTMTNDEGGTDSEEFRVAAVVDRLNTTLEVWMGTTMACAQCHDHKYDPFSQVEYYRLYAFLNQTEDRDRGDDAPTLLVPPRGQRERSERLTANLAGLRKELGAPNPEGDPARARWVASLRARRTAVAEMKLHWDEWRSIGPFPGGSRIAFSKAFGPEKELRLEKGYGALRWVRRPDYTDGKVHVDLKGSNSATYLFRTVTAASAGTLGLSLGSDDSIEVWVNGKSVLRKNTNRAAAPDQERIPLTLTAGENRVLMKITNGGGPSGFYFRPIDLEVGRDVVAVLAKSTEALTPEDHAVLTREYRRVGPEFADLRAKIVAAEAELAGMKGSRVPIMRELSAGKRRETRVHERGDFRSPGASVRAGVPAMLPGLPDGVASDRLGFARWLVDTRNPLTARVTVNRFWEQLFGIGIVETIEDFGTRGAKPTHPLLLDWLARRFMNDGWRVKGLLRLIVTSKTYRQDSRMTPRLRNEDPRNRLLARGPRFRMKAEMLRDQALAVGGLLSSKMHGPSVMPHQPPGIWQVVYNNRRWSPSPGEDRFRRGLYTFWRRTSPYPSMTTFDAPSREFCVSRRVRTNTPLQALVLLNDPVFVEAAQGLARRMLDTGPDRRGIARGFRLALARDPTERETTRLLRLFTAERAHYATRPKEALEMATAPIGPLRQGISATDAAAMTIVANVLLNLDEFLVKP